jgi:hypothetical protein
MNSAKWHKFVILKGEKKLLPYLPETCKLTYATLWRTLECYQQVIIKPDNGSFGYNIIQLSLKDNDNYEIHHENKKITICGRDLTYSYLKKKHFVTRFIIQQRIPLIQIDGCPFDFRVMVQRKTNCNNWVVTGKITKLARKGFIITNVVQKLMTVDTALQNSSFKKRNLQELLSEIDRVALITAKRLEANYPLCRMIGLDIGIDHKGKVWIIEANLRPAFSIFKLLEDKTMYHRIKSFKIN